MSLLGLLGSDKTVNAARTLPERRQFPLANRRPDAQPVHASQRPRERFLEVVASADPDELAQYEAQWEVLAATCIEPNVFYEHWMLLPAMRHYANDNVQVALVLERDPNAGMRSTLVGVFPLERCPRFHGLPSPGMCTWRHPHCYLCSPLIARDYDQRCWEMLLNWLRDQPDTGRFLDLRNIRGDGPLMQSFETFAFAGRLPLYRGEFYGRAMLDVTSHQTGEQYLQAHMGGDHRRGYARKKRTLAGRGSLQFRALADTDDLGAWVDDFLRLESSGWKGKASTAMACSQTDREFFASACREAHLRRRLVMMQLTLDGKPIAGHMGINAGDGSFALKIAYDEAHSAHSPGVLLEIEAIHELHRLRNCRWIDCCSAVNGEAMKRVWKQQRLIASVICPTGKLGGRPVVAALPLVRYLRGRIGSLLKRRPAA